MERVPPDFVIVGAPKCGTTSIHAALSQHPGLYFSRGIKEPHFFSFDYPKRREVKSLRDYDRLFSQARQSQLTGEASVYYLSSRDAVPAILARRPDAKFIAMVRNPVEMFVSLHNENMKALDEDESDPERAWALQESRARGLALPRLCKEPAFLQYRTLCELGAQVERLYNLVPEKQRLVIFFDDLHRHPRRTYRALVDFLGIEDQGTGEFAHKNAFSRHRSQFVARCSRLIMVNGFVKKLRYKLKPVLNGIGIRPLAWAVNYSLERVPKPVLSVAFTNELRHVFRGDVRRLERLTGRDLSHWSGAAAVDAAAAQRQVAASAPRST